MKIYSSILSSLVLVVVTGFPLPASGAIRFYALGDLPGGTFLSAPDGVSNDGKVVVGYSNSSVGNEAFRWTRDGGIHKLSGLPTNAVATRARDVSGDGRYVVATLVTAGTSTAIRWSVAKGFEDLGGLVGGTVAPHPLAISTDGSVIAGTASSTNGYEPFRWTAQGGMVGLNDLTVGTPSSGTATGISGDGSVVVGFANSPSGQQGFVWTPTGGMKGIGDLAGGGFDSAAGGISQDGTVIVGDSFSTAGYEAFRWTPVGGIEKLGWPNSATSNSNALSASERGAIIVGFSISSVAPREALIQDTAGLRTVRAYALTLGANVTGWQLQVASDVSANGRHIVGHGTNPSGGTEGWILSILPDPPTLTLTTKPTVRAKKSGTFKVQGTAADDAAVVRVEYKIGSKGAWITASGRSRWSVAAKLKKPSKKTKIFIRSVDEDGQKSRVAIVSIVPA